MEQKYARFMKRVRDTQTVEIDCSACLDGISQYVDLELATGEVASAMPLVHQHLRQCSVCFEEYQVLLSLAQLEANDGLPSSDALIEQLKQNAQSTG